MNEKAEKQRRRKRGKSKKSEEDEKQTSRKAQNHRTRKPRKKSKTRRQKQNTALHWILPNINFDPSSNTFPLMLGYSPPGVPSPPQPFSRHSLMTGDKSHPVTTPSGRDIWQNPGATRGNLPPQRWYSVSGKDLHCMQNDHWMHDRLGLDPTYDIGSECACQDSFIILGSLSHSEFGWVYK